MNSFVSKPGHGANDEVAGSQQATNWRPRISFTDAKTVRVRVRARARDLHLRCGASAVLEAVLDLLLQWKRVRDDQVRVHQVGSALPVGARRLSDTTIGRLLAKLAALELITYVPARGRGACAQIAIHPSFLAGIHELPRDSRGRIVTENVDFSRPPLLIGPLGPKTSQPSGVDGDVLEALGTRPDRVLVDPDEVRAVLGALPAVYRSGRWLVGKEVKRYLARGWRPEQILKQLAAPMPPQVRVPHRLAVWRLAKNMLGAGPRLRVLQRRWDELSAALVRRRDAAARRDAFAQIAAELMPRMLEEVAAAQIAFVTRMHGPDAVATARTVLGTENHRRAQIVSGVQRARRRYPKLPMAAAVTSWLRTLMPKAPAQHALWEPDSLPQCPPTRAGDLSVRELLAMTPAGRCVHCQSIEAVIREELPLRSPVCEDCWDKHGPGAELCDGGELLQAS